MKLTVGPHAQFFSGAAMAESVGDRLKLIRGLETQVEFARRLGFDKNTIGRYERGERQPDAEFLAHIANDSGVSLDWLVAGKGPMRRDQEEATAPAPAASEPAPVPQSAPPLDGHLLGLCFEGVRATYRDVNARIDDRSAGEMAGRLYADVIAATEGDPDPEPARRAAIRMGLQQLRRELLAAPSGAQTGKHSA